MNSRCITWNGDPPLFDRQVQHTAEHNWEIITSVFLKDSKGVPANIQVVPGRAGGGSFRRKKNYIAKKEFAYRLCARRPTSAMPKPFLCCERAFCCSMVVMWPVLMHVMSFDVVVMSFDAMWLLVLCHVTWCNAMSCDVRSCDVPCNGHVVCSKWFCDDVVIQSTILYYSSTTLYYKVLLQYYSVLHSTTTYYSSTTLYYKVLLQYYSSTTLYCKVLLQHYSVLQSTTPALLCTAKYYSSTTLYYTVLQRTIPVLLCTKVRLQYYKAAFMIDPRHIWNVIYNARSNESHTTTSPNTAPATQNDCDDWSASHMKRHLQCAEQQESKSNFTKYCACHANWISWLILVTYEKSFTMRGATRLILQLHQILRLPRKITLMIDPRLTWTSFTMRGATGVTIQLHQILRLPRKLNLMINPRHIWNVIHSARNNRSHNPTSPNTAPATQNESHDWSASHIKRHLQCAEQQESQSNFTKYCPCHAKWIPWLIRIRYETSFTMRGATRVTLQLQQILRLPRKVTLMIVTSFTMRGATLVSIQHHQILRLPWNSEFKMSAENPWIASANRKTIRG